ncbi:MAG: nickel insertion protein [Thermoplasmata archaeon]
MKQVYLDMTRGISGDMFVSASYAYMDRSAKDRFRSRTAPMIDRLGLRLEIEELRHGDLSGYRISWQPREKIASRSAAEARTIVRRCCDDLDLSDRASEYAADVFRDIVSAEARAHNAEPEQIHLHEIGRTAGLANIALAALCVEMLSLLDAPLIGSYISIGEGKVDTSHGRTSIPTPAASYLLEGLRFRFGPFDGEMATPTGISIARNAIRRQVDTLPIPARQGIGFGTRMYGDEYGYARLLGADEGGG